MQSAVAVDTVAAEALPVVSALSVAGQQTVQPSAVEQVEVELSAEA